MSYILQDVFLGFGERSTLEEGAESPGPETQRLFKPSIPRKAEIWTLCLRLLILPLIFQISALLA